jgi:hypothetical protein
MPPSLAFEEADDPQWDTIVRDISGSVPMEFYILPSRRDGTEGAESRVTSLNGLTRGPMPRTPHLGAAVHVEHDPRYFHRTGQDERSKQTANWFRDLDADGLRDGNYDRGASPRTTPTIAMGDG